MKGLGQRYRTQLYKEVVEVMGVVKVMGGRGRRWDITQKEEQRYQHRTLGNSKLRGEH